MNKLHFSWVYGWVVLGCMASAAYSFYPGDSISNLNRGVASSNEIVIDHAQPAQPEGAIGYVQDWPRE